MVEEALLIAGQQGSGTIAGVVVLMVGTEKIRAMARSIKGTCDR